MHRVLVGICDSVRKAAGAPHDWQRAIPHRYHLRQPTRLEQRRHDDKVCRSVQHVCQRLAVHDHQPASGTSHGQYVPGTPFTSYAFTQIDAITAALRARPGARAFIDARCKPMVRLAWQSIGLFAHDLMLSHERELVETPNMCREQ